MSRGKCGAANHVLHMLRDDLFVADAVLHGADRAVFVEGARRLRDGDTSVNGLSGDDAKFAVRKFIRIAGGIQSRGEFGGAGDAQSMLANGFDVISRDVISPDFGLALLGEVRGEETANRAATDDADFQQGHAPKVRHNVKGSGQECPLHTPRASSIFYGRRKLFTLSGVSPPLKNFHGTSARHSPSVLPIR